MSLDTVRTFGLEDNDGLLRRIATQPTRGQNKVGLMEVPAHGDVQELSSGEAASTLAPNGRGCREVDDGA
jgi:hypothetical protein